MRGNNIKKIIVVITVFFATPVFTLADEVSITNSVSVSASSGGNSADAGEIVEGAASVHIKSETIVDGEVVEQIDEHIEDTSEVSIEITTNVQDDEVVVESEITAGEAEADAAQTTDNIQLEKEKETLFASIKAFFKYVFSIFTT